MIGLETPFQRDAWTNALHIDAGAVRVLRSDGLLEIRYVPTEERSRKARGRDEYIEGLGRSHTIRVHAGPAGHPPFGRCGYQWSYCATCRASDLPGLNEKEMSEAAPSTLYDTATRSESPSLPAMPEQPSRAISVSRVEPVRGEVEGYEVLRADRALVIQRERKLVDDFCSHLEKSRRRYVALRAMTGSAEIECDVYDETTHVLYEAKSEALYRPHVRMAIGQLLDYAFHCFNAEERASLGLSLLLPHAPNPDIEDLLVAIGIGIAFRDGRGGFLEERRPCSLFAPS